MAAPALNGALGAPVMAADEAFPVLLMVTALAADVLETETDPKFTEPGAAERVGAGGGDTVIATTALVAVFPRLLVATSESEWLPVAKTAV